jgi:formate/nitrite transporter FocA (FNT family)
VCGLLVCVAVWMHAPLVAMTTTVGARPRSSNN